MPLLLFWSVWSAVALLASAWLAGKLVGWSSTRGAIDIPNARSIHVQPIPVGGGLAIVAVTIAAAALVCILHPDSTSTTLGVMLPAAVIAAVSWIDDIRPVAKRIRFAVHLGSAIAAVAVLGPVRQAVLGSFGSLDFGAAAWPLTLLWIVGLTNAFNFMDGIDGIAGLTAVVAGTTLATASVAFASPAVAGIAAAFAMAACGFLTRNWQPARIFMGDVGSTFCGFLLAVLPLALPGKNVPTGVSLVVAALWPFIFDTGLTIIRRGFRRENIFQAHRSHLYQRLVIAGWSHAAVSSLYGMLSLVTAALAVVPLFEPALRGPADVAAAASIALGILLLLALVSGSERKQTGVAR
jgi:UDP-N-acetylmuramyl pentapeptide phosphotransferase/UDP-N-acetylglucosamine-1-phosphate transferase